MSFFSNKSKDSISVLSKILADTYALLLKTQNVHWNVEGTDFRSIHLMTEEHYNNLFDAVDVIAERIRMVGGKSPATFEEFSKLASFDEKIKATDSKGMLEELLKAHEAISEDLRSGIKAISATDDCGSVDVLNSRLAFHEKTVWMLEATLQK